MHDVLRSARAASAAGRLEAEAAAANCEICLLSPVRLVLEDSSKSSSMPLVVVSLQLGSII